GLIGFLVASWLLVFSSAKDFVVDFGNVADWVVAIGTIGLLICAILGFSTWKKQRQPEVAVGLLRAVHDFEVKVYMEYSRLIDKLEYHNESNHIEVHEEFIENINKYFPDIEYALRIYQFYYPSKEDRVGKIYKRILDVFCYYYEYKYFNRSIRKRLKKEDKAISEKTILIYAMEIFLKNLSPLISTMIKEITGKAPIYGRSPSVRIK
ncbi:hypothetical protein ACIWO4_11715, partial [Avibacterium paragallinarum]